MENNSWKEMSLKVSDKRLWHQSAKIDTDFVVVGGVKTNIHTNQQETIVNAYISYSLFVVLI